MSKDSNKRPPYIFGTVLQTWTSPPLANDKITLPSVYSTNNLWDWDNLPPPQPPMSYAAALASRPPPPIPTPTPPTTPPHQQKKQQQQRGRNSTLRTNKKIQLTSNSNFGLTVQTLEYCDTIHFGSNAVTSLFLLQALNWTSSYATTKFNVVLRKKRFATFNWRPPSPPSL